MADFDGDGVSELLVGRIPVSTRAEADRLVSKLLAKPVQVLSSAVVVSQDDGRGYLPGWADDMAALLPSGVSVDRLDADSATPLEPKLVARLEQGADLVAYFGHGAPDRWAGGLLDTASVGQLGGSTGLYVLMTCLNGSFDDPGLVSLGEAALLADGGASAVLAVSGRSSAPLQRFGSKALFKALADEPTMGSLARKAKLESPPEVRRSLVLLGDPMLRIEAP